MNRKLSVGVIGTGSMGESHVRTLRCSCPSVMVSAISDTDENRMRSLAEDLGGLDCFSNPMTLIDQVDALVIASPDATHCTYVLAALEQKKPVFCEKPLASTVEDAVGILQMEESLGIKLVSVGFNRRFDNRHTALKQLLADSGFGRPLLFKGEHRNARAMYHTDGPFILNNSGGHDVDSACWLLGSIPKEVYCYGIRSRESLDAMACDLLVVNLLMENGSRAIAEIYVNAAYGYEVNAQVVCQEGVLSTAGVELVTVRRQQKQYSCVGDDFRAYFAHSYRLEMQNWVHSLTSKVPFQGADAWDGYLALLTTNIAGYSLTTGTICPIEPMAKPSIYQGEII